MEAKAVVRHVRMSPRKMRVVANLVRGKRVEEAMSLLKLMPKKGAYRDPQAPHLGRRQRRAAGRGRRGPRCSFATATSTTGPILKRWMPRSMGRANRIQRRTSHVTVVVKD